MSATLTFEEAASRLSQALRDNKLEVLQTSDFRVFIHETSSNNVPSSAQQLLEDLLAVLSSNHLSNNNQLVAATAYCKTVLNILQEPPKIYEFFLSVLMDNRFQEWTIFLCHGIFQINCWKTSSENGDMLLEEIFTVVKKFCCDLTSTCYLAFKVLHSLLNKVHELYPKRNGISGENFKSVLDIVLSNWENPLSGVRQQNSLVLNQLLLFSEDYWINMFDKNDKIKTVCKVSGRIKHQCLLELVLTEFSWTMKSKYFLLCSIVQDSNIPEILTEYGEEIIEGLIVSLSIPYLVSAGTDLYIALLASLTLKDWEYWFLKPFIKVISQAVPSLETENIFNYWMNQTVKKFPSVYENLVMVEKISSESLFSFMALHKLGRKEGLTKWEDLDENRIVCGVINCSDKIRSEAMSLVCTASKTSAPPTDSEFKIVKKFLKENINSDDSALRQNLLKSLNNFMVRIKDATFCVIKLKNGSLLNIGSDSPMLSCVNFLHWLHSFLLFNLDDKCNYQRKITSLEIYKIVLSCFGEEKKMNDPYKRKTNKNSLNCINLKNVPRSFSFESDDDKKALFKCLFDEDNSIRSTSAEILMCHYQLSDSDKKDFEILFEKGMSLCKDQIFYKAESGAVVIHVLVTLAYKSSLEDFKTIINYGSDSLINVLLSSAEGQFTQIREDLLEAASQEAFLYGTLQLIEVLISDSSIPELTLNQDQVERLIKLIEEVVDYFISVLASKSDSLSDYAPSFGEMGMAVAAVVEDSSVTGSVLCEVTDSMNELQLTPAQQLVLSCIWLNLKECTKLCSWLVSRTLSLRDSQRCVSVVVTVLKKCRHKGAIESAGLDLYHICKHLTKSDEPVLINLPEKLLVDFLQMLVGTTAATVSRRSAGLAILVHRLITGDSRPRKPLLHLCVSRLQAVAEDADVSQHAALVDLPQCQALHFLRTLVQESSLREHMAQYTLSISLLALTNLSSPHWTMRNAALQLFGALVPKLVGQKPNQEQGQGVHHLAFEELYTHARPLVELVLKELTAAAVCSSMTSHSKLMPLLTLVTNLTLGLHTVLTPDLMTTVQQFQQCFKLLLKSSIFNVRKLSSKAWALFATSSSVIVMMKETAGEVINYVEGKESRIQSENELHGYVLLVTHLFERFQRDKRGMKVLLEREDEACTLIEEIGQKLLFSQCSYFTKALMFDLILLTGRFGDRTVRQVFNGFKNILTTDVSLNGGKRSFGVSHFINRKVECTILTSGASEIVCYIRCFLLGKTNFDVQYSSLKALIKYIKGKQNLSHNECYMLFDSLKDYLLLKKHVWTLESLIFEAMLCLLKSVHRSSSLDFKKYFFPELLQYCLKVLSTETLIAVSNLVLPVTCAILIYQDPIDADNLLRVWNMLYAVSKTECDQEARLSAAKAIRFMSKTISLRTSKKDEFGELFWRSCVNLLQDEVAEVRYETSKSISTLIESKQPVMNPFICLELLFDHNFCKLLMPLEKEVPCLSEKLQFHKASEPLTPGISNPYDHGVRSIFAEEKVISQLAFESLQEIKTGMNLTEDSRRLVVTLLNVRQHWNEKDDRFTSIQYEYNTNTFIMN